MWNLDGYLSIGFQVGGLKRRCRSAAFNDRANAVVIELVAEINGESSFVQLQCSRTTTIPAEHNSRRALSA
jgi:hypothetical protein